MWKVGCDRNGKEIIRGKGKTEGEGERDRSDGNAEE